jgi:hypothetical protein
MPTQCPFTILNAILVALLIGIGCHRTSEAKSMTVANYPKIVFMSRDGCVNTPLMRKSLDAALVQLSWPKQYVVLDAGKLPASDPKRQYGTPTVLVDGRDLMGRPVPIPSDAEPG